MSNPVGPAHYPLLIALARFGAEVFDSARDELGDMDGGHLQELMQKHGLLHEVRVFEPCSTDDDTVECRCCEYGDFPQECLRSVDGLPDLIQALIAPLPSQDQLEVIRSSFNPDDAPIG